MISLGLVGYPLEHSFSPQLHLAALESLNMEGSYLLFPVPPSPHGSRILARVIQDLRQGRLQGLNVTIPLKQAVIDHLDALTRDARMIGAVNTIYSDQGRLIGDNTDAAGFLSDLRSMMEFSPNSNSNVSFGKLALVLGAGGAARAIVYALLQSGWRVKVASRRLEQARRLQIDFERWVSVEGTLASRDNLEVRREQMNLDSEKISALPMEEDQIKGLISTIDLLVNATPVGMWPIVDRSPWPAGVPLPDHARVYDLVYNPPITHLVGSARAHGLEAATGAGMLVEQAALAFERWTGLSAPRQVMRDTLEKLLYN